VIGSYAAVSMQNYGSEPSLLERALLACRGAIWAAAISAALLAGGTNPRTANAAVSKGTLVISPSIARFGSLSVGSQASISLIIANTGAGNVTFSSESLSGSGFTATPLVLPSILAPGKRLAVTIIFAPKSPGQFTGYLELLSDATNGAVYYEMTGTGVQIAGGLLTATPTSASFGSVPVGTSNSQALQLKNTGTTNLTISASGVSSPTFTLQGLKTPLVLGPGETVGCTLVFTPRAIGYVAGNASITSTASNGTLTLTMSGSGVAATPALTVTPTTLVFGNETVGNTETLPVTLNNSGNSSVTVSSVGVTAADIQTGVGMNGATIAPGQSATLSVSFSPKRAETVSGSVTITSNAKSSPTIIQVSGTGVSGNQVPSNAFSVALTWQASTSPNITGYYVYRANGVSATYSRLVTTPVSGLNYSDASVLAGESYTYAVTAVDSSGQESTYSSPATATIP
jgi:Abnormal spindle-like microcephaly-assoc'd, ASPM-SPD-2-Hydin